MKNCRSKEIGKLLSTRKWAVFIEILLVFGLVFLVTGLFSLITPHQGFSQQLAVFTANILLMALVWLSQKIRGESLKDLGVEMPQNHWKHLFKIIFLSIVVFILGLLSFLLGAAVVQWIGPNLPPAIANNYEYLQNNPGVFIVSLFGVYLVSSFGEELVYRAYLMHRIIFLFGGLRFGNLGAVLLSAIIFGLAHYKWGIGGVIQTIFMGVVLSSAFLLLKKRLPVLVLAHIFMDTLLLASIYFA